jgi:hypothetical protein
LRPLLRLQPVQNNETVIFHGFERAAKGFQNYVGELGILPMRLHSGNQSALASYPVMAFRDIRFRLLEMPPFLLSVHA